MKTHTPGPWYLDDERNPTCVWAREARIAEMWERDADADLRLIAAAPDLLAASKELLAKIETFSALEHDQDWLIAIRAAIAKAEGR